MSTSPRLWMFVGSYGPADEPTVHVLEPTSGFEELVLVRSFSGIANPSFLRVAPSGKHVYAVSETADDAHRATGHVHALRIEPGRDGPRLEALGRQESGGDLPCHLAIDGSGRWLTVSNYGTGSVAVMPIRPDGGVGEIVSSVQHSGSGPVVDRQRGPHAHSTVFTADGRFLVAADLGTDQIVVYAFEGRTGSLRLHRVIGSSPGSGPRHLAFDPTGTHLFVIEELASAVTVYRWDSGEPVRIASASCVPPSAGRNISSELCVAAGGRFVYAANRGDDSVAVLRFDGRHRLDRVGVRSSGGAWPRGLALTPDMSRLIAANERSGDVVVLPLAGSGADVAEPTGRVRVSQPTCVTFWRG